MLFDLSQTLVHDRHGRRRLEATSVHRAADRVRGRQLALPLTAARRALGVRLIRAGLRLAPPPHGPPLDVQRARR